MEPSDLANKIMVSHVSRLLKRNGEVSIELGQLVVRRPDGEHVLPAWLQKYSPCLLREILDALGMDAYEYVSYATGHYGKHKHPGASLQFSSVPGGENAYTIFNVGLTRARTTKNGVKGSALPDGHFHVGPKSDFYKLWLSTGLSVPKSLTSFHDYMGRLKSILYTASPTQDRNDGRLVSGSIQPLSVTAAQIRDAFSPGNFRTKPGHEPDTSQIKVSDKVFTPTHEPRTSPPISTTGNQHYGKTVISEREEKGALPFISSPKRPQDQSLDEWTDDLCKPED